jgi:nitrite reductase (NO-forming)
MKRFAIILPLALLGTACQSKAPAAAANRPATQTPTAVPANLSHGDAPVGTGSAPVPIDAAAPPRRTSHLQRIRFEISDATVQIATGVNYSAWTFEKRVPGPFLRATVGDTIDFTLVNTAMMPHDSLHYRFVPHVPGVFLYHCGTAPVAAHIANGMYGALIIDPVTPRASAKEFVIIQSEFHLTPDSSGKACALSRDRMLSLAPDYVVFNGRASQYAEHPLRVAPNELVRLYVVNAGPNRFSAFHVVGGILERVFVDGSQSSPLTGVQTVAVPVGGASIFEIRLKEAGDYPFVTHAFAGATKGAIGILRAEAVTK